MNLSNLGDRSQVYDWFPRRLAGRPLGAFSESPGAARTPGELVGTSGEH